MFPMLKIANVFQKVKIKLLQKKNFRKHDNKVSCFFFFTEAKKYLERRNNIEKLKLIPFDILRQSFVTE